VERDDERRVDEYMREMILREKEDELRRREQDLADKELFARGGVLERLGRRVDEHVGGGHGHSHGHGGRREDKYWRSR
jgi:hypothetical protein